MRLAALLAVPAAALTLALAAPAHACDCGHEAGGEPSHDSGHAVAEAAKPAAAPVKGAQIVKLTVTEDGFVPAEVRVKKGQPVQLEVTRLTNRTCATEIVMKDFGVNQPLPLGKVVSVTVTPKGPGAYRFACAMDMIAGTLRVE